MEILNRVARFNYDIIEEFECGIVLTGTEVKSIRDSKCNIKDSYAVIRKGEIFLLNTHISPYKEGNIFNHGETRTRKLLMNKREIVKLDNKVSTAGYTLVPLKIYFKGSHVKVLLGLCRGKKEYDKKETIKERDLNRDALKQLKSRNI